MRPSIRSCISIQQKGKNVTNVERIIDEGIQVDLLERRVAMLSAACEMVMRE
jgi:hypothetical protein